MNKAKKLLHTRYRVNDLESAIQFYKNVLGLEEVRRHKSPRGSELVFMKGPGSEELIELCCFPASGPVQVQPDLTHLAFEVDSLEEFGKHLAQFGIQYSDGPHLKSDGGGIAFIDAPEGYEIELIQRGRGGENSKFEIRKSKALGAQAAGRDAPALRRAREGARCCQDPGRAAV